MCVCVCVCVLCVLTNQMFCSNIFSKKKKHTGVISYWLDERCFGLLSKLNDEWFRSNGVSSTGLSHANGFVTDVITMRVSTLLSNLSSLTHSNHTWTFFSSNCTSATAAGARAH